jgi:protein-tyrosine phosphatase
MSPLAVEQLRKRGVRPVNHLRLALPVNGFDFETSELVVAMHETEHRPLLESRWSSYSKAVRYWHVPDIDARAPRYALSLAEGQVEALLAQIAGGSAGVPARLAS